MKKASLFIAILIALMSFTSCVVNENTGEIMFINYSDKDLTLKVGDISMFAAKGAHTSYFFSTEIMGKVSAEGAELIYTSLKEPTFTFKPGYGYTIFSLHSTTTDKNYILVGSGSKPGSNDSHNPNNLANP